VQDRNEELARALVPQLMQTIAASPRTNQPDRLRPAASPLHEAVVAEVRMQGWPSAKLWQRAGERELWLEVASHNTISAGWYRVQHLPAARASAGARWKVVLIVLSAVILVSVWGAFSVVLPMKALNAELARMHPARGSAETEADVATSRWMPREFAQVLTHARAVVRERRQMEAARATMLQAISHDLRSPLARIRLQAELLSADDVPSAQEAIQRNVDAANQHLERLLQFSAAANAPVLQALNVSHALSASIAALGTRDGDAIRLDIEPAHLSWPLDPNWLTQWLSLLINNARAYGAAPIVVRARAAPNLVLEV
jgi:two-component system, OmpR family, osmolarity sensor histidine kinase EnvZ